MIDESDVDTPTPPHVEPSSKSEDEAGEDLPDWLIGDVDPEATTQFTDDLKKMEEERQAKIKEFEEAQKKEQEESGDKVEEPKS